jgi:Na+-transporting NADH:ubiquinone oxidoreductase subunit A
LGLSWVGRSLQPSPRVYLQGQVGFFEFGIKALSRIVDTVNICQYDNKTSVKNDFVANIVTHRILGKYPASDSGVVLYHTKKSAAENQDWYIDGQDVIDIGKFLKTGAYSIDRIVAFSDGSSKNSCHLKTLMGIRLKDLAPSVINNHSKRWVMGGFLSGSPSAEDAFLDPHQT